MSAPNVNVDLKKLKRILHHATSCSSIEGNVESQLKGAVISPICQLLHLLILRK